MIVAKIDETKELFEKNLKLLTPWLRESVLKISEKELWEKIEITYNSQGYPICRYHQDLKCFHITSEHPVEEVEKWSKTILQQGTGAVFLYGCGFGYSLFEVFAHKKPHTLVILFEQDIYLFKAMLYYFDLEPIIQTQKIVFLIGDSDCFAKAFEQLFYSIIFFSCTFPTIAFSLSAQRNFKAQYTKIHKYVFLQLSLLTFYIGNDHLDNLIGFRNLVANTKEILQNPYISSLKDKYKDIPAFIIANGPSLDINIHQLKKIQGKGLIISVESAIVPLMKKEIKPDILTIIERTKYTYTYHFENKNYPNDIALICLALVDEQVYPSFHGEKIPLFRSAEAINQWFNLYLGDGSNIDAGANVSHLALELATYLGANPIVFVGQDYAYGPSGVTHSKDAVYSEEKGKRARKIIHSFPLVYVEGNNGTMIPSNRLWADFKLGLERKIAEHPNYLFLNATEGGAKIEGTKCRTLNEVIEEYCTNPIPYRVNELISESKKSISPSQRKERLTEFIKSTENYVTLFRSLAQEAITGMLECKEMIRLSLKEDSAKNRTMLEEMYVKNNSIYQLFTSDGLSRCFSQQVIFVFFYLMNRLGTIDTSEEITEAFKTQYNFFCHLNVISQSVSVHLENAAESLKDVLRNFENNEGKGGSL